MPLTSTLNEFVLAAHFAEPLSLGVMDVASWVETFFDDFPELQQLPPAGRVELAPVSPQFQFLTGTMELPRMLLRDPRTGRYVLIQDDRFAVGWARLEPLGAPAEYPGYATMKENWRELIQQLLQWYSSRTGGKPTGRLLELAYHNAIPREPRLDDKPQPLANVYNFLKPLPRPVNGFNMSWSELITSDPAGGQVNAQAGVGVVLPAQPVLAFNFTGLHPFAGAPDGEDAIAIVDTLHARILDMRAASIISEAS